jgi:hypothetical protein
MCEQSEISELSAGAHKTRKAPPIERRALRVRGRNLGHTKLDSFCDGFGFEKANLFTFHLWSTPIATLSPKKGGKSEISEKSEKSLSCIAPPRRRRIGRLRGKALGLREADVRNG